jgi:hypothetical protein
MVAERISRISDVAEIPFVCINSSAAGKLPLREPGFPLAIDSATHGGKS